MKKKVLGYVLLLLGILLVILGYCLFNSIFPKAKPIRTPELNDIRSVSVAINAEESFLINDVNMEGVLKEIRDAKPTRIQSLNDYPTCRPFYELEIKTEESTFRYFIYEEGEEIYVEVPYEGVYAADIKLFDFVLKYFEE